jgi:hypothetical protein
VAGTIAAQGNDGGVIGVAWNARVMAVKFLAASGSGYASDAIEATLYAIKMGAKVINASWGGGGYSQALRDAIAAADDAGVLFVAAAGTTPGQRRGTPLPVELRRLTRRRRGDGHTDTRAIFQLRRVDLAPGHAIYSTVPVTSTPPIRQYSGTPMAAPHVSAALSSAVPRPEPLAGLERLLDTSDPVASLAEGR